MTASETAEKQILRSMGIGRRLLQSSKDDLELMERALAKGKNAAREDGTVSLITTGSDIIQNVIPGDAFPADLLEVWHTVRDMGDVSGIAEIPDLKRGRFDLRIITRNEVSPRRDRGDITMTGVRIHVGNKLLVNPFLFRLVCSNGMQRIEEEDVLEVPIENTMEHLRLAYAEAVTQSLKFGEEFVRSDEITIPNPTEYALRSLRVAGAGAKHRAEISELIPQQAPNGTLYETLNVVTAYARQLENPGKRNKLEGVAGRILAMQAGHARCPSCGS